MEAALLRKVGKRLQTALRHAPEDNSLTAVRTSNLNETYVITIRGHSEPERRQGTKGGHTVTCGTSGRTTLKPEHRR